MFNYGAIKMTSDLVRKPLNKKICIIGLDGVGYENARLFIEKAGLQALNKALNHFVSAPPSIPPYTPLSWTSIFTGVNPGKHGIFGFFSVNRSEAGSLQTRFTNSTMVMYPRIFEILSMVGLRGITINIPLTYPFHATAMKKNIVVSDWAAPKQQIYPTNLNQRFKEYLVNPPHQWIHASDPIDYINKIRDYLSRRLELYYLFLEEFQYDVFSIVFSEPDWIMHKLPNIVLGDGIDAISEILSLIDRFISKSMELCELTVLVSDHGFQRKEIAFNINSYLAQEGLLKLAYRVELSKLLPENIRKRIVREGSWPHEIKGSLLSDILSKSLGLISKTKAVRHLIPHILEGKAKNILPVRTFSDMNTGLAAVPEPPNWGVYVKPGYERVVSQALGRAKSLKRVMEARKLFKGPFANKGPDLIAVPHDIARIEGRYGGTIHRRVLEANHSTSSLLLIAGDNVRKCTKTSKQVTLFDMVPTLLTYMGLPLPHDTDGRILFEAFDSGTLPTDPPKKDFVRRYLALKRLSHSLSKFPGKRERKPFR